jgi:TonB family protein
MLKREVSSCLANRECRLLRTLSLLMMLVFLSVMPSASQTDDQDAGKRKVITRVEPEYPESLKRLYVGGVVRVAVLIAPNGLVKSAKLLGGSPFLAQSAMNAIRQWRYAPAASNETLTVKLEFDSHR